MRGTVFQLVGDAFHYWVVVAEKNDKVLALSVTDARHCVDSPCKLMRGEHAILTKDSAVYYRKAMEFSTEKLRQEIIRGTNFRKLPDFDEPLLQRMIRGAFQADDFTGRLLGYFQ